MNMTALKEFVSLENRKTELEAELKKVKARQDELEHALVDEFVADGIKNVSVDGRTVYLARDVYAGPKEGDKDSVIDALKEVDATSVFVSEGYNANTLKSYVREIAKTVEDDCKREERIFDESAVLAALPEPLQKVLKVSFVFALRSRK